MPLYIDNREPNDIIRRVKNLVPDAKVQRIESGDFVFGNCAIERKAILDLISSVISGERHMWNQLDTMRRTYEDPILLVEGPINHNDKMLIGILTTIILFNKYRTIFTKDKDDTAKWINELYLKYGKGKSGRPLPAAVHKKYTNKEMLIEMLQVIPGIGGVLAQRVVEEIGEGFTQLRTVDLNRKLKKVESLRSQSRITIIQLFKGERLEGEREYTVKEKV